MSTATELTLDRVPAPDAAAGRPGWAIERRRMEAGGFKHTPLGLKLPAAGSSFDLALKLFGFGLRLTPAFERGMRNAADVRLVRREFAFADLPPALDGYRILHLTDLHVDEHAGTTPAAAAIARGLAVDACVLTGDFRAAESGPFEHILPDLRELVGSIDARDGVFGILGNHDCAAMIAPFERLGIRMLVNESACITRGGARISLTGTDDVHRYYTDRARDALESSPDGFRIALVHSPEAADIAERSGARLYLTGHTHGGQIRLPGGTALVTHLHRFRGYRQGAWRHRSMVGYTGNGTGVSGLPVRFHSRGEVALITLRRA